MERLALVGGSLPRSDVGKRSGLTTKLLSRGSALIPGLMTGWPALADGGVFGVNEGAEVTCVPSPRPSIGESVAYMA